MVEAPQPSLEPALAAAEARAESVQKSAASATRALKRVRTAAHTGNLRDLRPSLDAAEQAIAALRQEFANAKESWDFDEEIYLASGAFQREVLATAQGMNVHIFEQDDRLYSYPSLVRVLPAERAVLIDKTRERRLRPSMLVAHLRDLQKRPARFRPEAFLEALYDAYTALVASAAAKRGRTKDLFGAGTVVRLVDVYDLLTLLPGQSKEYSRQEFGRDIYLLDQSGKTKTRGGQEVSFPASTGTRTSSGTIRVITQSGREKVYYGIAFQESATPP